MTAFYTTYLTYSALSRCNQLASNVTPVDALVPGDAPNIAAPQ